MNLLSLQKMVALLILPAGLGWLLILVLAGLCLRRRQWLAAGLALLLALGYGLAGNVYLGAALMARLEAAVPPLDLDSAEPFDAVLVLGGGCERDGLGRPELNDAGDRLYQAVRLWHAGKARLLVASGVGSDGRGGIQDSGQDTRQVWLSLGVPDSAIRVLDQPCWITREEIAGYRRLQDRCGWQRVALVSSASHLPRAMALAQRAGLRVIPVGADYRGRRYGFELRYLVPQGQGFMDVHRACWEMLGRRLGR